MLRTVKTENGLVQGLPAADPRITSFKGVPFAAPPTGENRWRAPQPASDWNGVLKAYTYAPISMQAPVVVNPDNIYCREWAVDPDIAMDEDCLYLNIWTPANACDEKLPVYVWYFGGGLQSGYTAEMEFDGERIARRGIVVVTVNYRLNVFGFLCHPEITAESPDAPANFGHLDQRAGLLWVHRNIHSFGGDPGNVTIGGQSAGAGSVLTHLTSPQNEGLFQKAIIQSGLIMPLYPGNRMPPENIDLMEAEEMGAAFFNYIGAKTLQQARTMNAGIIRDKMLAFRQFFGTVNDGQFCVDSNYKLVLKNKLWPVPLLLGNTADEFVSTPQAEHLQALKSMAYHLFGENADRFLALCFEDTEDLSQALKKATINSIEYTVRTFGRANVLTGSNIPMFYYQFDAEIPGWDNPGTFHSVDLWFFFETLAKCWRPFVGKHYDLARQMCNYWANFIRSGNPNGFDASGEPLPHWEPYTEQSPFYMHFAQKAEFIATPPSPIMGFLVDQYFGK